RRPAHDVEAFGIGLHQAVLDAVVHHLHEVPRARRAAVEVARFRAAAPLFTTRRAGYITDAGRQRAKDRLEAVDRGLGTTDHQTVAALGSPDAAARTDVDVVDALFPQRRRTADVVLEVRVAAVDDRVA